jgi:hypothetical protein
MDSAAAPSGKISAKKVKKEERNSVYRTLLIAPSLA